MIAFTAEYAGGDLTPDDAEIAEARWFACDAVPDLPPSISISRRLIDATVVAAGRRAGALLLEFRPAAATHRFRHLCEVLSRLVVPSQSRSAAPVLSAQDGRELTEEARKEYATGLKEAGALVKERMFDDAQKKLDALLAQRPREPQARFLKGVVETEQGRPDAAIARVPRADPRTTRSCPSRTTTSPCSTRRRAITTARGSRSRPRSRTAPDWAVARENLGDIYVRLAAAEYDRAATLDRDNKTAPAKLVLARDLLAAGAPAKPKS